MAPFRRRGLAAVLAGLLAASPLEAAIRHAKPSRPGPPSLIQPPAVKIGSGFAPPPGARSQPPLPELELPPAAPELQPATKPPEAPPKAPLTTAGELAAMASAKDPPREAALRFDGGGKTGGAPVPAQPDPGSSGPSAAGPPAKPSAPPPGPRKEGFLRRLVRAVEFQSKAESWFVHSLAWGLTASLTAPILYKSAPSHTLLFTGPIAILLPVLMLATIMIWRLVRFLRNHRAPDRPRGPPGRFVRAGLLALALGLGLGASTAILKPQLMELGAPLLAPQAVLRRVHGSALKDELILILSRTAEGRDVLDQLRDRGGRIRMPDFFVSKQGNSIAASVALFDGLFINQGEITSRGWTVEEFARSPERQRRLARELQVLFLHELRHSNQFRRSIFFPGQFLQNINLESEYESAITEHLHIHGLLKADPHSPIASTHIGVYLMGLKGFDTTLRLVDSSYPDNEHVSSPYYDEYIRRMRAAWPALQVEGYVLLAKRSLPENQKLASQYLFLARLAAVEHGLPLPSDMGLPPYVPPVSPR